MFSCIGICTINAAKLQIEFKGFLAAVSQAVALVFDHVLIEMDQSSSSLTPEAALPAAASEPGSAKASDIPRDSKSPRGHGTTNAALKLLDDLCMMATGDALPHARPLLPRPALTVANHLYLHCNQDVAMCDCQVFVYAPYIAAQDGSF